MNAPTGKLAFAYKTIQRLEARIAENKALRAEATRFRENPNYQ